MTSLVLALFSFWIAYADDQNKQSQPSQVPSSTNQNEKLKGIMSETKIIQINQSIIEKVKVASAKMKPLRSPQSERNGPQTLAEAGEYLAKHIAMVGPPDVCVEYDGVFYFSGGTSTKQDTNFLSGFAIKKGEAMIHSWHKETKQ